jgi:hypothetical protein
VTKEKGFTTLTPVMLLHEAIDDGVGDHPERDAVFGRTLGNVEILVFVALAQHLVQVPGLLRDAVGVAVVVVLGHGLAVTLQRTECVLK